MAGKSTADTRERDKRDARDTHEKRGGGDERAGRGTDAAAPRRGGRAGVLRIIGGTWRGRRLRFPAQVAIRPTPDRVRETLFNWLASGIAGARCLDLFAGSGALGLEALSRGAGSVQFIEREPAAARAIVRHLEEWGAAQGTWSVRRADALAWLADSPSGERGRTFDVVFVDPPFESGLAAAAAERLERGGWLAERALIYLERPASAELPVLPERWTVRKSGRAGEVGYHLLERAAPMLERAAP